MCSSDLVQGDFELKNQISTSHFFLYGNRFWSSVKAEIEAMAGAKSASKGLIELVRAVADGAAARSKTSVDLTLGISIVGLMTLNQVGLEAFKNDGGSGVTPSGVMTKSPDAIVRERHKDDSQGLFSFLKSVDKKFTVNWCDSKSAGSFRITNDADIATASALDRSED